MTNKARNTAGKFSAKSETPRKVRSVNLTENCWQWLARIAEESGMSRNDYLEALADSNPPIMETVEATANPIMETVEATANPIMETVEGEAETSDANITKQPDIKLLPIMETVEASIELHKQQLEASDLIIHNRNQEIAALSSRLAGKDEVIAEADEQIAKLESDAAEFLETKKLYNEAMQEEIRGRNSREAYDLRQQQQISDLKHELEDAKLATQKLGNKNRELERGYGFKPNPIESKLRLEIGELQSQLSDLRENSAPASRPEQNPAPIAIELPDAGDLLNKVKAQRKKSKTDVGDIEVILEILEGRSWRFNKQR
jgi:chromosome segregation ATPase